ncbi:LytTR family DNA-binding domain-containing protein [uncultured Tenacibaculum sp.]|uniref:LytR/AlgR family response regulator transcription factor n=1 Tax=uncultured Tenacibaculum sp. TaxID=174713 RepID=UPI00260CAA4C|nr:LytTR family DNA-binding domain-containing protein [uncultured Tenacibaculum sp.]
MKIVIVEDEHLAAEKLERYIQKYNSNVSVLIKLSSIVDAVTWFEKGIDYDVAFMDIQLTDGLSFEIFNQVKITKPVIFTTAFDEYAIDAFKVNSIDYLLKPITFTDVSKAMVKLKTMESLFVNEEAINKVKSSVTKLKTKDRFLVRLGNHIHSIKTTDILLFYAEGRTVYLVTKENKKYILDYKLEDLIKVLESSEFFRVNRTFIVSLNGVEDVIVYSNSRLKITPKVNVEKEIIVSREKVSAFKSWFEGD